MDSVSESDFSDDENDDIVEVDKLEMNSMHTILQTGASSSST